MKALARTLRVPLPLAVGYMELLWHFAGHYTPRGDLGRYSDDEIAEGVGWPCERPAAELVEALVAVRFVDRSEDHRLIIHDWSEHADDAVHKQLKRKGLLFADRAAPYARNKARGAADPAEPEPSAPPVEPCRDMSRHFAPVACLPEPEPEPEPEPSGSGSVQGSESCGPPPPPAMPQIQRSVGAQPAALRQRVVPVDRKSGMRLAGDLIREHILDWPAEDPPHGELDVADDPVTEEQLAEVEERMHQQMPPGFPRPGGGDVAELIRLAGGVGAALAVCAKLGSRRERPRSYALFHAIAQDRPLPKRAPPVSVAAPAPEPVCERCGGSGMISPQDRSKPAGMSMDAFREQLRAESRPCGCRAQAPPVAFEFSVVGRSG